MDFVDVTTSVDARGWTYVVSVAIKDHVIQEGRWNWLPKALYSTERGNNEIHLRCAAADVYQMSTYKAVSANHAKCFWEWTQSWKFRNTQDIGGSEWKLKTASIYALFRKSITKATELGGNYRLACSRSGLPAEENTQLADVDIERILPYLKHAIQFKMNMDACMVPPIGCTQINPDTHPFPFALLQFFNREVVA